MKPAAKANRIFRLMEKAGGEAGSHRQRGGMYDMMVRRRRHSGGFERGRREGGGFREDAGEFERERAGDEGWEADPTSRVGDASSGFDIIISSHPPLF